MTWFTDADVEAAARATFRVFWPSSYWPSLAKPDQERYLEGARAALAAIPDPRAAGRDADGFDACQRAVLAKMDDLLGVVGKSPFWNHGRVGAQDALRVMTVTIAALKPEDKP